MLWENATATVDYSEVDLEHFVNTSSFIVQTGHRELRSLGWAPVSRTVCQ